MGSFTPGQQYVLYNTLAIETWFKTNEFIIKNKCRVTKAKKISNHTEGEDLYGSLIIHKHQKKYAFIYRQVKYDMNRNISRENTDVK